MSMYTLLRSSEHAPTEEEVEDALGGNLWWVWAGVWGCGGVGWNVENVGKLFNSVKYVGMWNMWGSCLMVSTNQSVTEVNVTHSLL